MVNCETTARLDEEGQTKVPPLSDALQLLLGLSDEDRLNLRLFELIALKDPAAVARLMSLADSTYFNRGAKMRTLSDALKQLGSQNSYDALLSIWAVELIEVPTHLRSLRGYLTRHIFSLCATARRLVKYLKTETPVDANQITILAILDKLGPAMSMTHRQGPVLPALMSASADGRHLLHAIPELRPGFLFSAQIAKEWKLPQHLTKDLDDLANWEQSMDQMSTSAHIVLTAEAMLDAKKGLGNEALAEPHYDNWPILRTLYGQHLDPMELVAVC